MCFWLREAHPLNAPLRRSYGGSGYTPVGDLAVEFSTTFKHTYEPILTGWSSETANDIFYLDPELEFGTIDTVSSSSIVLREGSNGLDALTGLPAGECAYVELETSSAPQPFLIKVLDVSAREFELYTAECQPTRADCMLSDGSGASPWVGPCDASHLIDTARAYLSADGSVEHALQSGSRLMFGFSSRYAANGDPGYDSGLCDGTTTPVECKAPSNAVQIRLRDPTKMPTANWKSPDGPIFRLGVDVEDELGAQASIDVTVRVTAGVNNVPQIEAQSCTISENLPEGSPCEQASTAEGVITARDPQDAEDTLKYGLDLPAGGRAGWGRGERGRPPSERLRMGAHALPILTTHSLPSQVRAR